MRVDNLYSESQLIKTINEYLIDSLDGGTDYRIDKDFSNSRIAIYSVSVFSGLLGAVYKHLPKYNREVLLVSIVLYFSSQTLAFILENILYSKVSLVVKYNSRKFNVYTKIDGPKGDFIYYVYPSNERFNKKACNKIPLSGLFYANGESTEEWNNILEDIIQSCKEPYKKKLH